MQYHHIPVLLHEAIDYLNVKESGIYVDATAGGGGYTFEIIKQGGRVIALDQDESAIEALQQRLIIETQVTTEQLRIIHTNFRHIDTALQGIGVDRVDGVVFDLGLSSFHLEGSGRGFSFRTDEKLDMRMDRKGDLTAFDIINKYTPEDLYFIFARYGEEHFARKISEAIINRRKIHKIQTASELAKIVNNSISEVRPVHKATKVFQALRIEVNDELNALKEGLYKAFDSIAASGRIVVVDFHSLEDRIVKQLFKNLERQNVARILTVDAVEASAEEIRVNARSRSAKLRALEKL